MFRINCNYFISMLLFIFCDIAKDIYVFFFFFDFIQNLKAIEYFEFIFTKS